MTFDDLGLSPELLQSVSEAGYNIPTPIHAQAIPVALQGRDLLGCAQTGTGKTAAFTLPMIDILAGGKAKARMPRSLIITPTRELAMQIAENFEIYGKHHKLTHAVLIGGVSMGDQEKALNRSVDVLIATPGRLLDLFGRGKILLTGIKILVIDEADRMLDMGFIPDVERIVSLLPPLRQTLFFSATLPPAIRRLGDAFLHNPKEVRVDPPASPAENVDHALTRVTPRGKGKALRELLGGEFVTNALIFCNRKRDVDALNKSLKRYGFQSAALHGDMQQSSRTETLAAFKAGDIRFLVATDVAGRGIDVFGLSHVFNYDVPIHAEDYIHRIGRTGRAGHRGRAVMLAVPDDAKYLAAITKLIGKEVPEISVSGGDAKATPAAKEPAPEPTTEPVPESPTQSPAEAAPEIAPEAAPEDLPAAEVPEAAPAKPSRRRSRGRGAEAKEAKPAKDCKPEHEPATEKPKRETAPQRDPVDEKPARRNDRGNNQQVVGMGDHVPAFMRREPPRVDG
ncbi:MAG: DEAD/DEAH box helicase [Alphaproteobacteria bacterium]